MNGRLKKLQNETIRLITEVPTPAYQTSFKERLMSPNGFVRPSQQGLTSPSGIQEVALLIAQKKL
jgi:hypothetical protein